MNKVVFVTGATNGTGYAIAARFAGEGYGVVLTSRSQERAEQAAAELAKTYGCFAKGYALDIRDENRVKEIFADMDANDCFAETVVLNSADLGFGNDPAKGMDFFSVPVEEFQRVFETNLVWNFTIVRQAALRMKDHHKGAIVFISSNTSYRAIPNRSAYCASKGGINAMSRAFAVDLGKYGIRVNAVLPGMIRTDRWDANPEFYATVPSRFTPIGDVATGYDIADAVYYFAAHARNTTGSELIVDGGNSAQLYPIIPENS
jgi:3-oxoacyl-[acyl-carrier protein] reductase